VVKGVKLNFEPQVSQSKLPQVEALLYFHKHMTSHFLIFTYHNHTQTLGSSKKKLHSLDLHTQTEALRHSPAAAAKRA
jgi:hypothetical protein